MRYKFNCLWSVCEKVLSRSVCFVSELMGVEGWMEAMDMVFGTV